MQNSVKRKLPSISTILTFLYILLAGSALLLAIQLPNASSPTQMIANDTATGLGGAVSPLMDSIIIGAGSALGAVLVQLLLDYLQNRDWRRRHGKNHTPVVTLP